VIGLAVAGAPVAVEPCFVGTSDIHKSLSKNV
jgi:hypothetical protein